MMDARRLAMLEAMGIDVLALRARIDAPAHAEQAGALSEPSDAQSHPSKSAAVIASDDSRAPRLCIVCVQGVRRDARLARLFGQVVRSLALTNDAIHWLEANAAGALPAPPDAPAYLVLGASIAPALGAQLSTAQQNAAVIAVSAEMVQLPGGASGKRALWQVLKPIARRLMAERC